MHFFQMIVAIELCMNVAWATFFAMIFFLTIFVALAGNRLSWLLWYMGLLRSLGSIRLRCCYKFLGDIYRAWVGKSTLWRPIFFLRHCNWVWQTFRLSLKLIAIKSILSLQLCNSQGLSPSFSGWFQKAEWTCRTTGVETCPFQINIICKFE